MEDNHAFEIMCKCVCVCKYVNVNEVLGLRLQIDNVLVVILRALTYVKRDVH